VVLDAIGEWECASIWEGRSGELRKVWSRSYPNSLGLFYSAFTDLLGMTAIKDEYKLQQMSEKGDPDRYYDDVKKYMGDNLQAHKNMHIGIYDWPYSIEIESQYDIAAAVQRVFEEQVQSVMTVARSFVDTDCLVYMGGCAMNSRANRAVVEPTFKRCWSLPQPGDPSSAIGAVLYHTKKRIQDHDWGIVKHINITT
jgi:carbamoyltransferase